MKPVKYTGILGFGTVGKGAVDVCRITLPKSAARLGQRCKRILNGVDPKCREGLPHLPPQTLITGRSFRSGATPQVDIVVELFGGTDTAKSSCLPPSSMANMWLRPIKSFWLNTAMKFLRWPSRRM